jgi:glycosyltransferase involved in cell wall biosynthesis
MKTTVSILIPTLNEEKYIFKCISSILNFKVPNGYDIEIIVSDGMSSDSTRQIISSNFPNAPVTIIDNEEVYQANGINKAVRLSNGKFIMRLDAHAIYPNDYLEKCLELINVTGADNVGGAVITLKGADTFSAKLVQALTTHPFGVGDSTFRTIEFKGEVDTVPYGFFRKEVFDKVGFLNEKLVRAQDYEFNSRIIKEGGKIFIDTSIKIEYFNQGSLFKFFGKQFFKEAPYNAYMWYLAPYTFSIRHAITAVFVLGLLFGSILSLFHFTFLYLYIGVISLYLTLALFSGFQQAIRYKDFILVFFLPLCFFGFHFIHGLGVLKGCLLLCLGLSPVQKDE